MLWSSFLTTVAVLTAALGASTPPPMDGFNQVTLDHAYREVTPAIGVLAFTAEITNPASGETSTRDGHALGLIVAPDGLVMTHGHMALENVQPVNLRFTVGEGDDEKEYEAILLKKPEDVNVCLVRIQSDEPLRLPYVKFSRETLRLGEPVALFGVLPQALDYARTLLTCRVGAILEKPRATYCLDQPVRFGFVTGPVINAAGRVVGVVGYDLSRNEGGELYVRSGHPLVYQADLFQRYIDTPPSEGEIIVAEQEAWLGVFTQPLTDDFAEYWGLEKNGGVIVSTVMAGSPADKAGCRAGDVIVSFDGVPVRPRLDREIAQFTKLVRETGVGKVVPVRLLRDGQSMELTVSLEPRPTPSREAAEYEDAVFGLTLRELTTDVRLVLNLPDTVQGVIIRRVKSGSFAQLAGMRPGVIIMNLGDYPITSLDDFREAVQQLTQDKPSEIPVFCRAGTATGFFRLEPRWDAQPQK